MGQLAGLAKRMNERADAFDVFASTLAVDTAMVIVQSLAYDTPVDTSKARSNWQVGLGEPVTLQIFAHFPGKLGSTALASSARTIAIARTELAAKKPGQPIYISNALAYIRKLNNGSSVQHPGKFVEVAAKRGRDSLRARKEG